jgi:hypothetical protein
MLVYANFAIFWMLMTWSLHTGDVVGMLLSLVGFLIMHTFCEEI